ncbi:hypothetical protein [Jiella sp. M17.18]|uniref:hypothetical protein n=1 Tax=Jiella sp. M17.18 TaxID=3234247 RepID=UPI0034DF3885
MKSRWFCSKAHPARGAIRPRRCSNRLPSTLWNIAEGGRVQASGAPCRLGQLGEATMSKLSIFASALTISIATAAAGSAFADCAQDLAAFKSNMNTQASAGAGQAGSTDVAQMPGTDQQSGRVSADKTPADKDQTAANKSGVETYTAENAQKPQDEGQSATGAVSGIAPTAALGKVASDSQESASNAGGNASASGSTSGDDAMTTASTGGSSAVATHLAAAQKAADAGNEQACMKALDAAKSAANQ